MAGPGRLTELSSSVRRRIEACIPAGPLVVALSGGADSAVCAWAASSGDRKVRAVHVDHRLPGSGLLEQAAANIAGKLGIGLTVERVTVPPGASPENQARVVRWYRALERALAEDETLLTGHTRDDQAETVLGNFLRGAGLDGLAGIPRRRGKIVRPMLEVGRSETRELADLLGLPWIDDPANVDPAARRNALRRELIPQLEERFNPGLRAALVRTAGSVARDVEYLEQIAGTVPVERTSAGVRLPFPLLATLPLPIAVRAVRRSIRLLLGGYPGSASEIEQILSVVRTGRPVEITGGLRVERRGAWLLIARPEAAQIAPAVSWPLPGVAVFGNWRFEAWTEEAPPAAFPLGSGTAVFDAAFIPSEALVRPPRPGDRIPIHGGSKAVTRVLAEAGVPTAERLAWPVVECGGAVLWVPGVRRGAVGWVQATTTRYLWVSAAREEGS